MKSTIHEHKKNNLKMVSKNFTQKSVKIAFLFSIFFSLFSAQAQAPQKFSYQAVVRNTSNALVTNQLIGIQIAIIQGSPTGSTIYLEQQSVTTNSNGLATLQIGGGIPQIGNFESIDWGNGNKYLNIGIDPNNGSNYTITSTTQLLSVPFALSAKTSEDNKWTISGNDISNNNTGNVGIGVTIPTAKLEVDGKTLTTELQVANNAGVGKVLTSDASGNATWQTPASQGITSIVNINGYLGSPIVANASSYVFAGPTQTVTITDGQKICGCASAPLSTTAGIATGVRTGLGYQQGAGNITNFVAGNYSIIEIDTERKPISASACITGLSAGTYTVGFIIQNGSTVAIDDNDYINGWFMVTN